MAALALYLLGTFQARLDGQPLTGFRSNKVRALLAYLAVEADRPHTRAYLAGLLWPEWPEAAARTYLRQALADLRHLLTPAQGGSASFLLAARHTIQLDPHGNIWSDTAELDAALRHLPAAQDPDVARMTVQAVEPLQAAVTLYRGTFLEGFFLDGCSAFEEWQLLTRERIRRRVVDALGVLVQWHEARRETAHARRYAEQRVELEPLLEDAHRHLLDLLARSGEPGMALAHYDQYRRLLDEELCTTPSPTIQTLVDQIRSGAIGPRATPGMQAEDAPLPLFLSATPPAPAPAPVFVERQAELAQLEGFLHHALAGRGRIAFITGSAGQGKSALLHEFVRRSLEAHLRLLVAGSRCSSHDGAGEPLAPVREILAQLCGDFERPWAAGELTPDLARRLWAVFPETVGALLRVGPDLVNTLLPGPALAARTDLLPGRSDWRARIDVLLARPRLSTQEAALLDQCSQVLQAVARTYPLLLWFDDLHWADAGTLALLAHLGRRLAGCAILVVGTYRLEEVALGRAGQRHPLDPLLYALEQEHGSIRVDLDQAQHRSFLDAYLDSEPNRLGPAFRHMLYALSRGHALFTVELLRSMQDQASLVRDAAGYWIEGPALAWEVLPTRVEAMIGERVDRLPADLRALLEVACVEGETFTAEVVAGVTGEPRARLVRRLSDELDRRHHLVVAQGLQRVGTGRLSLYRFRHVLFQRYLYSTLDEVKRGLLHEEVARALEVQYAEAPEILATVAGQLAWHYQQAELPVPAVRCLCMAGNRAVELVAHDEAQGHFQRGLSLLDRLPEGAEKDHWELQLSMGLGGVQALVKGMASDDVEQTFTRAHALCGDTTTPEDKVRVLRYLWLLHFQRGCYHQALALGQACLDIAHRAGAPELRMAAHLALGSTLYRLGNFGEAEQHLAEGRALYDAQRHPRHVTTYVHDPGVDSRSGEAIVLWYLGYGDQARRRCAEALDKARASGHAPTLAWALVFAAALYQRAGDAEQTERYSAEALRVADQCRLVLWQAVATLYQGWAQVALGEHTVGVRLARQGLAGVQQTHMAHVRYGAVLADALRLAGQIDESLTLVDDLIPVMETGGEREWEAELYRLRGELLRAQGEDAAAAPWFERALDVAARQQAKSLELRAALSLARLRGAQGQCEEARRQLAGRYAWFAEGFDLPDLRTAQVQITTTAAQVSQSRSPARAGTAR